MRFAGFEEGVIGVINIDSGQTVNGETHIGYIKHTVNSDRIKQNSGLTLFVIITLFEMLLTSRQHQNKTECWRFITTRLMTAPCQFNTELTVTWSKHYGSHEHGSD